ncbi:MAG: hypothetical protein ACRD0Q_06660 [Acidimicrobiales bacterium]
MAERWGRRRRPGGGTKTDNWQSWCEVAIPTADQRYDDFLRRRSAEGTQP